MPSGARQVMLVYNQPKGTKLRRLAHLKEEEAAGPQGISVLQRHVKVPKRLVCGSVFYPWATSLGSLHPDR